MKWRNTKHRAMKESATIARMVDLNETNASLRRAEAEIKFRKAKRAGQRRTKAYDDYASRTPQRAADSRRKKPVTLPKMPWEE
jgi:hypothetical protein